MCVTGEEAREAHNHRAVEHHVRVCVARPGGDFRIARLCCKYTEKFKQAHEHGNVGMKETLLKWSLFIYDGY